MKGLVRKKKQLISNYAHGYVKGIHMKGFQVSNLPCGLVFSSGILFIYLDYNFYLIKFIMYK